MRYLLILFFVGFIGVLNAAEDDRWLLVSFKEGYGTFFYMDLKTAKAGTFPEVWIKQTADRDSCTEYTGYTNCGLVTKMRFDCAGNRVAALKGNEYNKAGQARSFDFTDRPIYFTEQVPGTVGEGIAEYVCKNYYKPSKKK